ncbi:MAG: polysaccharide biosynthesis C-terminal domain-containing protein, partial [Chloroflexota bacterium]
LIHRLYRRDEQHHVLHANIAGAVFNLAGNVALLPVMGTTGALLSSTVMQWGMFAYYVYRNADDAPAELSGVLAGD